MTEINYKEERINDVNKIKDSLHPRKVVVSGPGTGKSYLFSELIKKKRAEGKTNFLAITFIGKLSDMLADDLCGLAETMTLHAFAREFVLQNCRGWTYYPKMYELIKEDLENEGIKNFEIGDENYINKTKFYKAIGNDDVVYYAVRICRKNPNKIPQYDLILIDEFQDFNSIESDFVDLLAQRSEIIIVGDDDQTLYKFKGSSPSFLRNKYSQSNDNFESHTLRFCSRCTEVMIKCFHDLIETYGLNDPQLGRIQKEFICYLPDKNEDSKRNSKIQILKNCPTGKIAFEIKKELTRLVQSQKIKDVLIIGEGRSCESILKQIGEQLSNYGFRNVDYKKKIDYFSINQDIVDAYKLIHYNPSSPLGWRILGNPEDSKQRNKHIKNAETLDRIINSTSSKLTSIRDQAISELETVIEDESINDFEIRKGLLFKLLKRNNIHLSRPLCNLDISVCNILNSKGLGADVVFLVGFDNKRFPLKETPNEEEVYQMLVAMTRAKKRIYLINTIGKNMSSFIDYLDKQYLGIREIT
ncbi:MAG: AAA family ATPase [Lentimicrobiaceae bacterium]|nr:AAA family ATPase [Lentimicrobiaceae bacterium]